jgi:SAM-dependent methyltransferase
MAILESIFPRGTGRRLAAQTIKGAVQRPSRLPHRLNGKNLQLARHYRNWSFTCVVCGHVGRPYYDWPDLGLRAEHGIGILRETLMCRACLSTVRHRALVSMLLEALGFDRGSTARDVSSKAPGEVRILDTDAYSPLARTFAAVPGYVRSTFVPGLPNGRELEAGCLYNVDLQSMPFPDASFDVIMSSDVMEHVRDHKAAHAEIARCLRPGGLYIFTLPYNADMERHRVLIDTSTDVDLPLEPFHFHGDPIRGGIVAYRIFGRQLLQELEDVGLDGHVTQLTMPELGILDADVFTARRRGPVG